MRNVVPLLINREMLTLLNLKPVVLITTVGKDGSTTLILGEVVSISAHKEIEKLKVKRKMIKLNPPFYFSFEEDEGRREWMFAEIGKIATITEKDEKIKITRENL